MQLRCQYHQFQSVKFPVIDSVWESEILGGKENFTSMAGILISKFAKVLLAAESGGSGKLDRKICFLSEALPG